MPCDFFLQYLFFSFPFTLSDSLGLCSRHTQFSIQEFAPQRTIFCLFQFTSYPPFTSTIPATLLIPHPSTSLLTRPLTRSPPPQPQHTSRRVCLLFSSVNQVLYVIPNTLLAQRNVSSFCPPLHVAGGALYLHIWQGHGLRCGRRPGGFKRSTRVLGLLTHLHQQQEPHPRYSLPSRARILQKSFRRL